MSAPPRAGDRAAPGADALRKAGLKRALFATAAALVLTASLVFVGEDEAVPEPPAAAPVSPAPVVAPAVTETPAAESPANVASAPTAESAPGTPTQDSAADAVPARTGDGAPQLAPTEPAHASGSTEAAAAPMTAPAAISSAAAPEPSAEARVIPPAPETQPASRAAAPSSPAAPAPRLHTGPPPGPGYLIQLGVFLDTGNAESMRRELEHKGYPAHLQARVVLGPYPDRQSAIAAQEKIRRERKLDGMILPPRK